MFVCVCVSCLTWSMLSAGRLFFCVANLIKLLHSRIAIDIYILVVGLSFLDYFDIF